MIIETITEVVAFQTSDGQRHDTLQLAKAHEQFLILSQAIDKDLYLRDVGSDDIVKWISDNRMHVREFLDAL